MAIERTFSIIKPNAASMLSTKVARSLTVWLNL